MSVVRVQTEPIVADELIRAVLGDGDGAVALFLGTVRDHNAGRRVRYLEYHAYPEMARREMRRLVEQAGERFDVGRIALVHRTGRLEIGEVSVGVAVASPHRAAGFDACRYLIDTLKRTLPIWKKEFFEGGECWIEGGSGAGPAPGR
jgi:molybdopterin synthase catalytic subunit